MGTNWHKRWLRSNIAKWWKSVWSTGIKEMRRTTMWQIIENSTRRRTFIWRSMIMSIKLSSRRCGIMCWTMQGDRGWGRREGLGEGSRGSDFFGRIGFFITFYIQWISFLKQRVYICVLQYIYFSLCSYIWTLFSMQSHQCIILWLWYLLFINIFFLFRILLQLLFQVGLFVENVSIPELSLRLHVWSLSVHCHLQLLDR